MLENHITRGKYFSPVGVKDTVSFYIIDHHAEHPIPVIEGVKVQVDWNGYEIERALDNYKEGLLLTPRPFNVRRALQVAFNHRYFSNQEKACLLSACLDEETAPHETVYKVSIWDVDCIDRWLDHYVAKVDHAIRNCGGDDDTFDYMPSFVETLYQVCEILGQAKRWNAFIEPWNAADEPPEFEFALIEEQL